MTNEKKKHNHTGFKIAIALNILVLVTIIFFMFLRSPLVEIGAWNAGWGSFAGGVVGGAATIIVFTFTIRQNRRQFNIITNKQPNLFLNVKQLFAIDKKDRKDNHYKCFWFRNYPDMSTNNIFNKQPFYEDDEIIKQDNYYEYIDLIKICLFELSIMNTGLGEAVDIRLLINNKYIDNMARAESGLKKIYFSLNVESLEGESFLEICFEYSDIYREKIYEQRIILGIRKLAIDTIACVSIKEETAPIIISSYSNNMKEVQFK